ncbi:hypothetical protein BD779DRAFT_1496602 [Infundibulicybe gibba]|nr:hypothetical protein BD779DRAFT_1496602 [Infundibulicybe gibba]
MDNPQHYQPLSHALHPPLATAAAAAQAPTAYTTQTVYSAKSSGAADQREEEEEEEEEDGDDEGIVEEQLNQDEPDQQLGSNPTTPMTQTGTTDNHNTQASQQSAHGQMQPTQEREGKRRPGRPRGSKNRKPRVGQMTSKQEPSFHYQSSTAPPQLPDVNAHNQQYYQFQWKVLNLCAEFYDAAEELVKGTPALVVAQCYHMGPTSKVDPLAMLSEAKRICDTLLANPSQLITNPPPPIYPTMPSIYQPQTPIPAVAPNAVASSSKPAASSVINNPQSFVVSFGTQAAYPQYPMYPPPPGQYPATSYYHHYPTYGPPGTAYQPQPPPPQPVPQPQPSISAPTPLTVNNTTAATVAATASATGPGVIQGAWSDEETERLKKLAEESKPIGTSGEIEWDWVVHQWGPGRTRHQILIKATSIGLKESSSRSLKRRRENDGDESTPTSVPPTPTVPTSVTGATSTALPVSAPTSASPSHSHSVVTPVASPALQNTQRPASSKGHPTPASAPVTPNLPWPMPTVAATTPSPVVAAATVGGTGNDQQRTSYYRPRPSQADGVAKPASHQYMYQPNGSGTTGSRLGKENGK